MPFSDLAAAITRHAILNGRDVVYMSWVVCHKEFQ